MQKNEQKDKTYLMPTAMHRKTGYNRFVIIFTVILVLSVGMYLIRTLYKIQVSEHEDSSLAASRQYYHKKVITPVRGGIYDKNGIKVAGSSFNYTVGITPKYLYSRLSPSLERNFQDEDKIADFLCEKLDISREKFDKAAAQYEKQYVPLAKDVDADTGNAIEQYMYEYQIGGIKLDVEPIRVYFNDKLASHAIGFCNKPDDNLQGVLGVEASYNDILAGKPGYSYAASDNFSRYTLPFAQTFQKAAVNGQDVYLTIDINLQEILQEHLTQAVLAYRPKQFGMGMAMNPQTGAILAMASYPYFDCSNPYDIPDIADPILWKKLTANEQADFLQNWVWRNKCLQDTYESGSTFKTITAAIGLEENLTNEKSVYNDQPVHVQDYTISCFSGGHGVETLEEGFWRSCNPVFVQIALSCGVEKFYSYIDSFGFTTPTGVDLPNEAECIFHESPMLIDLATLSFGEQSPVTVMHLMTAYSALVNGGKLPVPYIVEKVVNPQTGIAKVTEPQYLRQVISSETSERVRKLMRGMVKYSDAYTYSGGFKVGGKTSTSVDESNDEVTISFMEAGPIDHPELLLMLVLQRPRYEEVTGSDAQIVTMNCASEMMEYMNIDREYTVEDIQNAMTPVPMPDIRGITYQEALEMLKYRRVVLRVGSRDMNGKSVIKSQMPPPGLPLYIGSYCYAYTSSEAPSQEVTIPDFSGQNFGECVSTANRYGVYLNFDGPLDGYAAKQELQAYYAQNNDDDFDIFKEDEDDEESLSGRRETAVFGSVIDVEMRKDKEN